MALDRISVLPQPMLLQILCFLPQADAVRTCVLSKSWRHLGCSRPKVEFGLEKSLQGKREEKFESMVNKILQRYGDQNLPVQEFRLRVLTNYKLAAKLLRKWIPKLNIFGFYFRCSHDFHIPSSVFESQSLQKLYLKRCTLDCALNVVLCKHLKTLHLVKVKIDDETFKKIISSCPMIESVTFDNCRGFGAIIKVDDKFRNLKQFKITTSSNGCRPSIEFDIPSSAFIERIRILRCPVFFRNVSQRKIKSLSLTHVGLSSELLDLFSWNNMPSLEFLELVSCYGFEKEFHLSSRSIKHFVFKPSIAEPIVRATFDTPNILSFKYSSYYLPSLFSFTTGTDSSHHEWKSNVRLDFINESSWFLELHQLLKELSGSEISLFISKIYPGEWKTEELLQDKDKKPVVVEQLKLWLPDHSKMASNTDFVNQVLGICHPRKLVGGEENDIGFLRNFFEMDTGKKRKRHCIRQQDLEDVSMENNRFRLKWREI